MKAKKCPVCGETMLLENHGEYRMRLPANIGGGEVAIPDATWLHCQCCGEDILSSELEHEINRQCGAKPVSKVG